MNTKLNRQCFLFTVMISISVVCSAQKLLIQDYDTSWTRYILKNKLLEIYKKHKDDSSQISFMFFQIINDNRIKSFHLNLNEKNYTIRFFSKDAESPSERIQIDTGKVRGILSRVSKNVDISGEKLTTSTYYIIMFIRIGAVFYEVKTTNLAFYSEQNDSIDAIKELLLLINLEYKNFIHRDVDG